MGHVYADATLIGVRGRATLRRVLVDAGASYTVLEQSVLEDVGAASIPGKVEIELGDWRRAVGRAYAFRVKIGSHEGPAIAVSFRGAKRVIGVETLESLGLAVNPRKKRLEATRRKGLAYFYGQ